MPILRLEDIFSPTAFLDFSPPIPLPPQKKTIFPFHFLKHTDILILKGYSLVRLWFEKVELANFRKVTESTVAP